VCSSDLLFELFSNEIEKNPKLIELHEARAWLCYHILNNVSDLEVSKISFFKKQSEIDFTNCISTDPQNFKYYGSRSMLYTAINDYPKALKDINRAIELVPTYSRHYKDRAAIYKCIGLLTDSFKDIETAISLCEDERWKNEYIKFSESLKEVSIINKREKQIKSHFEKISISTQLHLNDIVSVFEVGNNQNKVLVEYFVSAFDETDITLTKTAIDGEPLKRELRETRNLKFDILIENKFNLLIDETNDKGTWPMTLDDSIKELIKLHDKSELKHISKMTWSEFQMEYNTVGGLDQWVRNYFGLWRGNYDLLLDSKIDKINADSASLSILYHFWEYVVDHLKSKK
jgi:tetratricopeptide (TPR) repeat protein